MFIKELKITYFKNLEELVLAPVPKPGITIFLGKNGQGKTNILEAIWLLSLPKPLRTRSLSDCINFTQNALRIQGIFSEGRIEELSLSYQRTPQKSKTTLNFGDLKLSEWLGTLQVTMFTPDDTNLISGDPGDRRNYLDQLLSRVDRGYFSALRSYKQCLKQRNSLLKQARKMPQLAADIAKQRVGWELQMIPVMNILTEKRWNYLQFLKQNLPAIYQEIANNDDKIEITPEGCLEYGDKSELHNVERLFRERESLDRRIGVTSFGPHRDEIHFLINQQPCRIVASRGEIRSITLAIKLAEIKFIEEQTKKRPILLLDDVFSELDKPRREKLLKLAEGYQTFITTVESSYFADYSGELNILRVVAGKTT